MYLGTHEPPCNEQQERLTRRYFGNHSGLLGSRIFVQRSMGSDHGGIMGRLLSGDRAMTQKELEQMLKQLQAMGLLKGWRANSGGYLTSPSGFTCHYLEPSCKSFIELATALLSKKDGVTIDADKMREMVQLRKSAALSISQTGDFYK